MYRRPPHRLRHRIGQPNSSDANSTTFRTIFSLFDGANISIRSNIVAFDANNSGFDLFQGPASPTWAHGNTVAYLGSADSHVCWLQASVAGFCGNNLIYAPNANVGNRDGVSYQTEQNLFDDDSYTGLPFVGSNGAGELSSPLDPSQFRLRVDAELEGSTPFESAAPVGDRAHGLDFFGHPRRGAVDVGAHEVDW